MGARKVLTTELEDLRGTFGRTPDCLATVARVWVSTLSDYGLYLNRGTRGPPWPHGVHLFLILPEV